MITSYVDESPTKKILTFEVPAEDVRKATDRTVKGLAKQIRLPGFRPGKVPPDMIRKRFAADVKNDVLEHLIQASVGEALGLAWRVGSVPPRRRPGDRPVR